MLLLPARLLGAKARSLQGGELMDRSIYQSPFTRYSSKEMLRLFSQDKKFSTWRELWIALAEAQRALGLNITEQQIEEMKLYRDVINYDDADRREREVRHDVMAHVYAYGLQARSAEKIIHLGATSCYVTDNTDILIMRDALELIRSKLLGLIERLAFVAEEHKDTPTLGYTHYQPATPTTVGKRASIWLQDFMNDLRKLEFVMSELKMLGCRGATGSSETFMELFDGDEEKCKKLEFLIAKHFDFTDGEEEERALVYPVSGQTYPRSLDNNVLGALEAIAVSAHKMAQDIRLLQHDKEMEEPFGKKQIGSSAMAYKRNPMRSERICSLSRHLTALKVEAGMTAATQMLERSLDDSAGRRIYIPEAFLTTDAILILCTNVIDGCVVNDGVINAHLNAELPFMAVEKIIMAAAKKGVSRQEAHEKTREISIELGSMVKQGVLKQDEVSKAMAFRVSEAIPELSFDEISEMFDASGLIGRCPGQVTDYLEDEVYPLLISVGKAIITDTNVHV